MSLDEIIAGIQKNTQASTVSFSNAVASLHLDDIQDRVGDGDKREINTRPLNPIHVKELCDSIEILGLICPIAVDSIGRLLAGGHRREAIRLLRESKPDIFNKQFPNGLVLVRRYDFDAMQDPERARQVEISENEKRRDYTPAEVRAIAQKLRDAGYTNVKGRPKKGVKVLVPALELIIGKSARTAQRYLTGDDQKKEKSATADFLRRALRNLTDWTNADVNPDERNDLDPTIQSTITAIKSYLMEKDSETS